MKLWYLYHSGVAVRTQHHLLIFDYWQNRTFPNGVIELARQEACPVLVFVSHAHEDHYNEEIFSWRKELPEVRYFLSDDIPVQEDCIMVGPETRLNGPDWTVQTLRSTDAGVAFLVELDGVTVYHAGDLHWWHWLGEPERDNQWMAEAFRSAIRRLEGKRIDVAFIPVDGRQEGAFAMGIDYFAGRVPDARLVPIHFSSDETVLKRLADRQPPYAARLCILTEAQPFAELKCER